MTDHHLKIAVFIKPHLSMYDKQSTIWKPTVLNFDRAEKRLKKVSWETKS